MIRHVALQNLSFCYTWKYITWQCKNNKLKIISPTWNDEFELLDGSYTVSDIQEYIEFIIIKYETLTTNRPIHIHINRIHNRLVLKIRDGYKLELQTLWKMKLCCSIKRFIDKKIWRKCSKCWKGWNSFSTT